MSPPSYAPIQIGRTYSSSLIIVSRHSSGDSRDSKRSGRLGYSQSLRLPPIYESQAIHRSETRANMQSSRNLGSVRVH